MAVQEKTAPRMVAILKEKRGPLPVWAWLIVGVAGIFVIMWWQRNRSAGAEQTEAVSGTLPGNQSAPPVFIVPQAPQAQHPIQINVPPNGTRPQPPTTVPTAPPGGGANVPMLPPTQAPAHMSVPLDKNIYTWISELNQQFPGLSLDFGKLEQYNPGFRKYIRWDPNPAGGTTKIPKFWAGWSGQGLGIPPLRIRAGA